MFGHVEKRLDKKDNVNFIISDVTTWLTNNLQYTLLRVSGTPRMKTPQVQDPSFFFLITYVVVIPRRRVRYGKYFPSSSYFATYLTSLQTSELIAQYEKRGKYLPVLHEATYYFIIKCLLKSKVARVILLLASKLLNLI